MQEKEISLRGRKRKRGKRRDGKRKTLLINLFLFDLQFFLIAFISITASLPRLSLHLLNNSREMKMFRQCEAMRKSLNEPDASSGCVGGLFVVVFTLGDESDVEGVRNMMIT